MFPLFKPWAPGARYQAILTLPEGANEVSQQFVVVAGGLGLILSRTQPRAIEAHFPRTKALYELLFTELRKYGKTSAGADLINEVMHEVAEHADPTTMKALKSCFRDRVEYDQRKRAARLQKPAREAAASLAVGDSRYQSDPFGTRSVMQHPGPASELLASQLEPASRRLRSAISEARQRRDGVL